MSFYKIEQRPNPTSRNNDLKVGRRDGQDNYTVNTVTMDTDIKGVPSKELYGMEAVDPKDNESKWTTATIENTLKQSNSEGRQLVVNIDTDEKLNSANRAARSTGSEITYDENKQQAIIKNTNKNKSIDNIKGSIVAYQALQSEMSEEDIVKNLKKYGYNDSDIDEIFKRVNIFASAEQAGISVDEITEQMYDRETTADTIQSEPAEGYSLLDSLFGNNNPKSDNYNNVVDESYDMTAEELVSSLKVIHPTMVSDAITTIPAYFGNKSAQQRYDAARDSSRQRIINIAKDSYNLDLVWQPDGVASEGWFAQTEQGLIPVTPGFMEDFKKLSGEIIGGISGAVLGAKTGAKTGASIAAVAGQAGPQAATPEEIITVPIATIAGGVIGAAVGGWTGSIAGSQFDYMYQAMKLQEDMEAEAMAYKALNAFEAAAIGEAIGYPVIKGLGVGWKGIVKAKDNILGGETKAAYKALKDTTFLDDSQIQDIVSQLEKYSTLQGNEYEKGIQAVALTQPGMQDLVRAAGTTKPRASSATARTVMERAEQVLKATADLTDEQVPRMLAEDLLNYSNDVKKAYSDIKATATQSPNGLNFEWDFESLAIEPVMDKLVQKITDPSTKEKFILQMRRVDTLSAGRSFGDLIELRQMVNDFLYNNRVTKADDKRTLRSVLNNIDYAIQEGAEEVVEKPKEWLKNWAQVRKDYSTMKQLEKTALYRAIFNKDGTMRSVQPETVVKALGKYVTALDGSFEEIMTKIPLEGRKMYEGAVIDALTNKFTAGIEKGAKAVHFPLLADELRKINFTTPNSRATKKALIELGETFKNDVMLAQTSGQIVIPKFQSYLTADPLVRAKYEVASGVFNYIKSKGPSDANKQIALVKTTSNLIDKPLDAKTFKEIQELVFDDVNLSKELLKLKQEAAKEKAKKGDLSTPKVRIYEGNKLKGTKLTETIPAHRIITLEQAKEIADAEALTLDSKSLDSVLRQYGYKAVLTGTDRVRLIGDK